MREIEYCRVNYLLTAPVSPIVSSRTKCAKPLLLLFSFELSPKLSFHSAKYYLPKTPPPLPSVKIPRAREYPFTTSFYVRAVTYRTNFVHELFADNAPYHLIPLAVLQNYTKCPQFYTVTVFQFMFCFLYQVHLTVNSPIAVSLWVSNSIFYFVYFIPIYFIPLFSFQYHHYLASLHNVCENLFYSILSPISARLFFLL